MVAIACKQGVSQTDVAEWYGLSRKTVYNWLQ
ncbi:helix-turn-helix domain-containing protein [Haladaptatus halobius]